MSHQVQFCCLQSDNKWNEKLEQNNNSDRKNNSGISEKTPLCRSITSCVNDNCNDDFCCNLDNVREPKTLSDLIDGLHKFFAHGKDRVNVECVQQFMTMYNGSPQEWRKFAIFDTHRYTRNLVDSGNGKFNLMLLCWNEGQGSSIHSHANSHCFMKVMDGNLTEELFEWPHNYEGEGQMNLMRKKTYERGQVAYICDEIGLHRVENPNHANKAVSLHLYSPPFDECAIFDEKTGHKNVAHMTFWSQYGKRTPFGIDAVPENN